jgi:hypothetical protein
MIDPRLLRDDPDGVAAALARRGLDPADLEELRDLDERRRALIAEVDTAPGRAEERPPRPIGQAAPDERQRDDPGRLGAQGPGRRLEGSRVEPSSSHTLAFAGSRTSAPRRARRRGGRRGGAAHLRGPARPSTSRRATTSSCWRPPTRSTSPAAPRSPARGSPTSRARARCSSSRSSATRSTSRCATATSR